MRYKFTVSYLGYYYNGSQKQPNKNTIQDVIEQLLKGIFKKEIDVLLASRTDKGVNAKGQVGSFALDIPIELKALKKIFTEGMPLDINVSDIEVIDDDFHPRFSAKAKMYKYYFKKGKALNLGEKLTKTIISDDYEFDLEKVNKFLNGLIGSYDFDVFRSQNGNNPNTIKKIDEAYMELINEEEYVLTIKGNSFLYHMIRIIVGTILDINNNKRDYKEILAKFKSGELERRDLGFVAKAQGLCLEKVFYE